MVLTKASRSKVWERTNEKQQINCLFSYLKSNPLALALLNMKASLFSGDTASPKLSQCRGFFLEPCSSPQLSGLAIL